MLAVYKEHDMSEQRQQIGSGVWQIGAEVTWLGLAVKVGQRWSVELRRVETKRLLDGSSATILHASKLHTQNEGGVDEPFKAGRSRSVLRLDNNLNPKSWVERRYSLLQSQSGDAGRQMAGSGSIGFLIPQSPSCRLERQEIIQYAKSNNCCTKLVEEGRSQRAELEVRG
jgi:hypothetical protein